MDIVRQRAYRNVFGVLDNSFFIRIGLTKTGESSRDDIDEDAVSYKSDLSPWNR